MDISCVFPPTPKTPQYIALAEQLGYKRAWAFDTPALQLDVWMTLARAAERTTRIELGPAAIIPSLRHVMTTAAAIVTLYDLAPGRVNVVLGLALLVGWRWGNARSPGPMSHNTLANCGHCCQARLLR